VNKTNSCDSVHAGADRMDVGAGRARRMGGITSLLASDSSGCSCAIDQLSSVQTESSQQAARLVDVGRLRESAGGNQSENGPGRRAVFDSERPLLGQKEGAIWLDSAKRVVRL